MSKSNPGHNAKSATAVTYQTTLPALMEQLRSDGVELVRLSYSDLHGTARGKDIPLEQLDHAVHDGIAFCIANLVDGLASNPTNAPGFAPDRGYPDMLARPLLSTDRK